MNAAAHFKLGLFVALSAAGLFVVVMALGLQHRRPTVSFHTYLDESVQGLPLGAPVEYRGIPIGAVDHVAVAPDLRHVDVTLTIWRDAATRLALEERHTDLRATLVFEGITGLKLVDLDWVPGAALPTLDFTPDAHYIPAQPSLLGRLSGRAQDLTRQTSDVLARVNATLDTVDRTFHDVDGLVKQIEASHLPEVSRAAITDLRTRLRGLDELIASARQSVDAFARFSGDARDSAREVTRSIRAIGDAARAFRELVDEVDREPDMLIKGHARTGQR